MNAGAGSVPAVAARVEPALQRASLAVVIAAAVAVGGTDLLTEEIVYRTAVEASVLRVSGLVPALPPLKGGRTGLASPVRLANAGQKDCHKAQAQRLLRDEYPAWVGGAISGNLRSYADQTAARAVAACADFGIPKRPAGAPKRLPAFPDTVS